MTAFKFISAYKHQLDMSKDIQFNSHVYLSIDVEKEGYIYFVDSDEGRSSGQNKFKNDGFNDGEYG